MKIIRMFLCFIGDHDWTSNAMEGKVPTKEQLGGNLLRGFSDYAKMSCKHCGKVSSLSL